ncbi:alpha-1,4-glucan--maltose-1-phosphate maltosyltransferase [Hoeflea marina]|nr:alpha-1,4-glucan--maltose-1-phosphate maltosyltransferase [Hoeflea marina]
MPPAGEAIARLTHPDAVDLLAPSIAERLAAFTAAGIGGFRLLNPERLGGRVLSLIAAELARNDVQTLAAPTAGRGSAAALAAAGIDCLVSRLGGSDLRSGQAFGALALADSAPVLAEIDAEQAFPAQDAGGLDMLMRAAAALASGLIVPETLLAGGPADFARAAKAIALSRQAAPYDGTVRRLAGSAGHLVMLSRTRKGDARAARGALLVLVNAGPAEAAAPENGPIIQRSGTPLDLGDADLSPLAPGEVRLIELAPAMPIIAAAPREPEVEITTGCAAAPRLVIEAVSPRVEGGDFAVKRVVGDTVAVSAAVFADGHEQLAAELRWRSLDGQDWQTMRMRAVGKNDLWGGEFSLERLGPHEFVIEAWLDRFGGFRRDFVKKLDAGVAQPVDHADGRALIEMAAARARGAAGDGLDAVLVRLDAAASPADSAAILLDEELAALMDAADDRPFRIVSGPQRVDAERLAARFSSWYELFPRSMTADKSQHGTLSDVIPHLARIRDMGFDTLYFPPIHPIGQTNRKGPNNTLTPEPHDVGSPYAIGSPDGGHDAIHPELGSFEDFDALVEAARAHGLEIALDFAIQASPDHPWLGEHPGWFSWRPDGSMKYAENPPKKYQDIVNLDFYGPDAVPDLWLALRDVVLLWIAHGVKTFRVDNPHTKPLPFWEWMIADVRREHPDAIFLAEAFTRPTMMYRLAKVGFSQSYTYFTWRDGKHELIDYITELTTTEPREFYRPHFFVNTPDINPVFLQNSGRPGFQIRAVLAATLSGLFGVYSGFELCEAAALPGREEYLDSEKYEIRPRDLARPGNIIADITLLNRLRRDHPALQTHLNTRFHLAHNDNMIWYGKPSPDGDEMIMVMVSLDPHHAQETHFEVPLWEFGLSDTATIAVEDLALGYRFDWHGKTQWIRITPDLPYRIWRLSAPGGLA